MHGLLAKRWKEFAYALCFSCFVLLSGCLAKPLIQNGAYAEPKLVDVGLLNLQDPRAKPRYTCTGEKNNRPKNCALQEVDGKSEYFSQQNVYNKFKHEWSNPIPEGRPVVGLALSGGGTKAANYAMGILQGMHADNGKIKADVISSVSGGSYSALWYYSRLVEMYTRDGEHALGTHEIFADCLPRRYEYLLTPAARERICPPASSNYGQLNVESGDPYRFQNQLRGYQDIFEKDFEYRVTENETQIGRAVKEFLFTLPTLPLHWLVHGVFDWKPISVSLSARRYFSGIRRTYAQAPVNCELLRQYDPKECDGEAGRPTPNGRAARGQTMGALSHLYFYQHAVSKRLSKLGELEISGSKLPPIPFWIANTTAGVSSDPMNAWAPMPDFEDSVFEFTPVSFGSRHYGYWKGTPPHFELAKVTGASGSFLDGQQRDFAGIRRPLIASALFTFNLNWGVSLPNPRFQDPLRTQHYLLPFPINWAHHRGRNNNGAWIHLSDGGMSDNLGVWSLLRRGVPLIVVADSAEDTQGKFADVLRLCDQLKHRALYLYMPQLEGFKNLCGLGEREVGHYDLWNWPHTLRWLEGCVSTSSTDSDCKDSESLVSRIVLFKPSIDWQLLDPKTNCAGDACTKQLLDLRSLIDDFPTELFGFLVANREKTRKNGMPIFPQHSTVFTTLDSSPWIYGAYRELARWQMNPFLTRLNCLRAEAKLRVGIEHSLPDGCQPAPDLTISIAQVPQPERGVKQ